MAASTPIVVDNSPGRTGRVGGLIALVVVLLLIKVFAAYGKVTMAVTEQNPTGGSFGGKLMLGAGWLVLLAALAGALWFLAGKDVTTISAQSRKAKRGFGLVVPVLWRGCGFGDVSSIAVSAHQTSLDTSTYAVHVRYGPQGKHQVTVIDNQTNRANTLDLARRVSALVGKPVQDRSNRN